MKSVLSLLLALVLIPAGSFAAEKKKSTKKKAAPAKQAEEDAKPDPANWSFRSKYTITVSDTALELAQDNGEWRIRPAATEAFLAQRLGYVITLGDGTRLTHMNLPAGETLREPATSPFGDATRFTITQPAKEGLQVIQRVFKYKDYPFLLQYLEVKNTGQAPILLKRISPVVAAPGSITFPADTTLELRQLSGGGGHPGLNPGAAPNMAILHSASSKTLLAIAVLPEGGGIGGIELKGGNGTYEGEAFTDFAPALTLAPGQTAASNPLWISAGLELAEVEQYHGWYFAKTSTFAWAETAPEGWISALQPGDIVPAAEVFKGGAAKYAVVPVGAGEPKPLARQLKSLGYKPGITLDVLGTANPREEATKATVTATLQQLRKDGFELFLIAPPAVSDEMLQTWCLSRGQAQAQAVLLAQAAVTDVPVYPAAVTTLKPEDAAWQKAEAWSAQLGTYSAVLAPVRLDVTGFKGLDKAALETIQAYPGPIEIVGTPSPGGRKDIDVILTEKKK